MATIDSEAGLFQLAEQWVRETAHAVFLTGKAGTGKTTFLKHIAASSNKRTVILAPTGVAAINAGGSTLHSFFKIPFALFLPHESKSVGPQANVFTPNSLMQHLRYSKQQVQLIRTLELIIIDEVSMVRVDLIDLIDTILRRFRRQPDLPFGGVQMLFIGDMHQLPPVVNDGEARILSEHYNSCYFFDSKVLQEYPPVHIRLNKVFRQQDAEFLHVLNELRDNEVSEETFLLLSKKVTDTPPLDERYITLTSHLAKADEINRKGLNNLYTPARIFQAQVDGDFSTYNYPASLELELKEGARVMFVKNDPEKKFYNGKMGTVTYLEGEDVRVRCDEDDEEIKVLPLEWQNTRYVVNKESAHLETEVLGTFKQIPLRHAWAVTIHKSQGLTFDYVIIDAGKAFASGQVYVALSRCRTWEGIVLLSHIRPQSLFSDLHIQRFSEQRWKEEKLENSLPAYKRLYQQEWIERIFDSKRYENWFHKTQYFYLDRSNVLPTDTNDFLQQLADHFYHMATVMQKFARQVQQLLPSQVLPLEDRQMQERLASAAAYFHEYANANIWEAFKKMPASPDNKQLATRLMSLFNEVREEVFIQLSHWEALKTQSDLLVVQQQGMQAIQRWQRMPALLWLHEMPASSDKYEGSPLPEDAALLEKLRKWRNEKAAKLGKPAYFVLNTKVMESIVARKSKHLDDLMLIKGMGKAKVSQYGKEIIELIN